MIKYNEYKGYSLLHWYLYQNEDVVNGVVITAQIRGEWKILASSRNINWLYDIIGIAVMDSAIVECWQCPENLYWYITIDLDEKGYYDW